MVINGYTLKDELKNADSGFSKWGFATKGGKEYFIKELINPVYPIDAGAMSKELFENRRKFCANYEDRYRNYYASINQASRGNLVRIIEFFRCGSRYYIVTEKVSGSIISLDEVSALSEENKFLLMKSVAYAFDCLHTAGIVHFDVKTTNILVKRTPGGRYTARVIDFDSGYFNGEQRDDQEIGGDLTYLAPETFMGICGEKIVPDEKSDIFALGLVFHEYYCGKLPYYDPNEYEYIYEAALDGGQIIPDKDAMPEELANLIMSMLDADPSKRPSAKQIMKELQEMSPCHNCFEIVSDTSETNEDSSAKTESELAPKTGENSWFSTAGDL